MYGTASSIKGMDSETYWLNATLRYRDSDWSYTRNVVSGVKPANRSLLFPGKIRTATGFPGFFLEHGLAELDAPGEYAFDPPARHSHHGAMMHRPPRHLAPTRPGFCRASFPRARCRLASTMRRPSLAC
jgi:hypothetical protein